MWLLPGSPENAFSLRHNQAAREWFAAFDYVALAMLLIIWARMLPAHLPLAAHVWLAAQCCLALLEIAWRRRCRGAPNGGTYARCRHWLAAAYRLNAFGFGVGPAAAWTLLDHLKPAAATAATARGSASGAAAALRHAALLLFNSGAVTMLLLWAKPAMISLAVPVQLALVLHTAMSNPLLCASAALSHPDARQRTHRVFGWMHGAHFTVVPGSVGGARGVPAVAECSAVLLYLQLWLGFFLPAAAQAVLEARLFAQHQRQRRRRGLPPESVWAAALYRSIAATADGLDGPAALIALWMISGIVWDLVLMLAVGQA